MPGLGRDTDGQIVQVLRPGAYQSITTSTTSAVNSADFGDNTVAVELYADVDTHIVIGGSSTTAAVTDTLLKSGVVYVYSVREHSGNYSTRVAARTVSAAGTLDINELGA